jgi:uncharacterized pyridoxamine 5'-phosphate oxidase family protein
MNAQGCLQILRDVKDVAFATIDEKGLPQIRIIDVMIVEDEKLYFCTARGKEFYKQLMFDGNVAITAMNSQYQMVRMTGKAEKLSESKQWIDRIIDENPAMNNIYPGESRYVLEPFCIEKAQLECFDLGREPIFRETFSIGKEQIFQKGFLITDACISCGVCKKICPQQCIEESSPYKIKQESCLHCGLCFENCPISAIKNRGE